MTWARAPGSRRCARFRSGKVDVLVATDVAARGIDVEDVTHVINFQCPEEDKTYIHRIGRTGRAGKTGIAVSFIDWDDVPRWKLINESLGLDFADPLGDLLHVQAPVRGPGHPRRHHRRTAARAADPGRTGRRAGRGPGRDRRQASQRRPDPEEGQPLGRRLGPRGLGPRGLGRRGRLRRRRPDVEPPAPATHPRGPLDRRRSCRCGQLDRLASRLRFGLRVRGRGQRRTGAEGPSPTPAPAHPQRKSRRRGCARGHAGRRSDRLSSSIGSSEEKCGLRTFLPTQRSFTRERSAGRPYTRSTRRSTATSDLGTTAAPGAGQSTPPELSTDPKQNHYRRASSRARLAPCAPSPSPGSRSLPTSMA